MKGLKTAKKFVKTYQNVLNRTKMVQDSLTTFITLAFLYFALVMVSYALHYPADGYKLTKYCEKWPLSFEYSVFPLRYRQVIKECQLLKRVHFV